MITVSPKMTEKGKNGDIESVVENFRAKLRATDDSQALSRAS